MKFNGCNDKIAGGQLSGRLTEPLVVLGSICKQYLKSKKIEIESSI
ncbi:chorismate synthase, partial [Treponema sp. R6D11]